MQGWYELNWVIDMYKRKRVPLLEPVVVLINPWERSWCRIPHILKPSESFPTDDGPFGVPVTRSDSSSSPAQGWGLTDLKEPGSTPGRSIPFYCFSQWVNNNCLHMGFPCVFAVRGMYVVHDRSRFALVSQRTSKASKWRYMKWQSTSHPTNQGVCHRKIILEC